MTRKQLTNQFLLFVFLFFILFNEHECKEKLEATTKIWLGSNWPVTTDDKKTVWPAATDDYKNKKGWPIATDE